MIYLRENLTGAKAKYKTRFSFHKSKEFLYFKFVCYNSKLFSYSDKYNDEIYHGDVCEVFIRNNTPNHYIELEVAPNGTQFLKDIENIDGKFGGILIEKSYFFSKVKCKKDKYIVKIKFPRSELHTEKIEFNAFRIETDGGIECKHLFALHPTLCNSFHKLEFIK